MCTSTQWRWTSCRPKLSGPTCGASPLCWRKVRWGRKRLAVGLLWLLSQAALQYPEAPCSLLRSPPLPLHNRRHRHAAPAGLLTGLGGGSAAPIGCCPPRRQGGCRRQQWWLQHGCFRALGHQRRHWRPGRYGCQVVGGCGCPARVSAGPHWPRRHDTGGFRRRPCQCPGCRYRWRRLDCCGHTSQV